MLAAVPAWATGPDDTATAVGAPVPQAWSASAAVGLGPLTQGSQSPTSVFRLSHPAGTPSTLGEGQWEIQSLTDWANYFCDGHDRYFLDYESLRARLSVAYGAAPRTQVTLSSSASYQGGGILDGFIEGFERSVGAINHDRRQAPRNRYLIRARDTDGSVREYGGRESGWHVENATFEVKHLVLEGTETAPSVVATAIVKLPIGSYVPGRPNGGVDVGARLDAGVRRGRFNLYGSLGVVAFGNRDSLGVDLLPYQLSIMTAVEVRTTPRTSLVTQALISGPVARHAGEFSDNTREIAIGLKHRMGPDLLLELSVVENLLVFGNSADIAFHAGLTWRPGSGRAAIQCHSVR
ncbi:MAG TPA: DUF3187 family protein [Thermoanaerobaculaceae bacterium]|nr:DUF3187 family protein [Thermoanaerobaculaceae bacterium]